MKKIYKESELVLWSGMYISGLINRLPQDEQKVIVQMECGSDGNYIVEVIDGATLKKLQEDFY